METHTQTHTDTCFTQIKGGIRTSLRHTTLLCGTLHHGHIIISREFNDFTSDNGRASPKEEVGDLMMAS